MDFFDSRYFRINKHFLSFVGLWPYQMPNMKRLTLSFTMLGIITTLLPQVIYFLKHLDNLDEVFAVGPVTCGISISFVKVICLTYNSKKFKLLMQLTQDNWNDMLKSQEMQIITRYAEMGRKFTLAYSYSVCVFGTFYALIPLVAPILDLILPLNETRSRKMLYPAEYSVNQEKYYHAILLSQYIGYMLGALIATVADTTYFWLLMHICGMQSVLCYRLENLKARCKLGWDIIDQSHWNDEIRHRVRHCIELDKRIRIYVEIMESTFATFLLFDIALGAILHTSTCIMIVIRAGQLSDIMRFVSIMVLQSIRFFFISWTGQEVTDHSSGIPIAAYNAMWYIMPIEVQKILRLLIVRSQRPSRIILAGIYIINLENFSSVILYEDWRNDVMKTSISYCTIMVSLRATTENT